jgi:hypothetical protein
MSPIPAAASPGAPAIDLDQPAIVRTATFALG